MRNPTRVEFPKTRRFHVRATPQQATSTQAAIDLADQNHFLLPPKAWNAFVQALDAPRKVPPGLKRLFARPPVAESR